jgi:hypothetical protein
MGKILIQYMYKVEYIPQPILNQAQMREMGRTKPEVGHIHRFTIFAMINLRKNKPVTIHSPTKNHACRNLIFCSGMGTCLRTENNTPEGG